MHGHDAYLHTFDLNRIHSLRSASVMDARSLRSVDLSAPGSLSQAYSHAQSYSGSQYSSREPSVDSHDSISHSQYASEDIEEESDTQDGAPEGDADEEPTWATMDLHAPAVDPAQVLTRLDAFVDWTLSCLAKGELPDFDVVRI